MARHASRDFLFCCGSPGTSAEIAQKLQKQMALALSSNDIRKHFQEQGAVPCGWDPSKTAQFIRQETEKWKKVLKAANVKL